MKPGIPTIQEWKLLAEPLNTVDGDGVFEGYASLFGEADLGKDVVMPGLRRVLEKARSGRDPAALAA